MNVAFDVDGTLIDENDRPRHEVIDLLRNHFKQGDTVYVWSGGGTAYAAMWISRLGLHSYVKEIISKGKNQGMDVSYDDMVVNLATENICVGSGDHEERW